MPVVGAGVSHHTAALPDWRGAIQSAGRHAIAAGLAMPEESSQTELVPREHEDEVLCHARNNPSIG